ncbi:MAG: DegT/DnrJ/EryC1/StrS family aminotransferase, partial [Candidatus Omnitrophica bacterium]|nr:DegT/DnrJ/EryC1/StrS family aminotransferase [Candidatus Omnitrophota bacterium]
MDKKTLIKNRINITEPTLPSFEKVAPKIKEIINSKMITNAKYVGIFENKLRGYLKVKHVISVNSCTSGLLLLFKALKLKGEVILPSFTFSATGHAVLWNNLKPV